MRHPWSLVPVLLVALAACNREGPPPALPRGAREMSMRDLTFPIRDLRFPSGLRVVVEEDHRSPTVAVIMLVGVGSTSDPPGKEGLAHYVEHLAFRARPDGEHSIGHLVERAGAGAWNAMTSFDTTRYYEVGPKESLGAFLSLEGVRLRAPMAQIPEEIAAIEREVVRSELREHNETGYDGPVLGYLQQALFPQGHAYARPVIGTHASLSTLTLADAQQFTAQHYRPDNVTIVVVGDVDLATVQPIVEQSLPRELLVATPGEPARRLDATAPTPPLAPATGMKRRAGPVLSPELWIGWTVPRSFDQTAWLERYASATLGGWVRSSHLDDQDIAGVRSSLVPGKLASMMLLRVALREGAHPEQSADEVLQKVEQMGKHAPATERLRALEGVLFLDLQRSALTGALLAAEGLISRGLERADFTHFAGDPAAYSRTLPSIMSATPADVVAFTAQWLGRERARTLLIVPEAGRAAPAEEAAGDPAPPGSEDAPPGADAATIRRFVRPPGVSAYRRVVLQNGLEIIAGRRAGLPLVTAALSFHGGAASTARAGVAEVAEGASFREKRVVASIQAGYGAHTSNRFAADRVDFVIDGPAGNLTAIIDDLARERRRHTDWKAAGNFVKAAVRARQRSEGLPEVKAERAFIAALFGASLYGRVATSADIDHVDAGDVNGWLEQILVPKNAVLVVVGEIDPDEVVTVVNQWFGRWSSDAPEAAPAPAPAPPAARPEPIVVHRAGATQGQIQLGCLLPAGGSTARHDLVAALLEERLTASLRRGLGATYGVHAWASTLRGGVTHLELEADVDAARLGQALGVVRRTLDELGQGRVEAAELDGMRFRVGLHYAVRFGTNGAVVRALLAARNQGQAVGAIDAYPEQLLAVDAAALALDYAACAAAPVLAVVGDEAVVRPAIAASWK